MTTPVPIVTMMPAQFQITFAATARAPCRERCFAGGVGDAVVVAVTTAAASAVDAGELAGVDVVAATLIDGPPVLFYSYLAEANGEAHEHVQENQNNQACAGHLHEQSPMRS